MYCNNCGTAVDQNAKFCPGCGRDISQQSESTAVACFDPMACSRELEEILPPLEDMEANYKKIYFYEKQASHAGRETNIIVNCACISAGLIASGLVTMAVAFLFHTSPPGILFILIWALVSGLAFKASRNMVANLKVKEKSSLERKQEVFREQYLGIYEVIAPVLEKYVPVDYRYSTAVQSICFYFRNMRADTMKEAINLYEEEMHRLRLENTAELTLRENQKQTAWMAFQAFELATIRL